MGNWVSEGEFYEVCEQKRCDKSKNHHIFLILHNLFEIRCGSVGVCFLNNLFCSQLTDGSVPAG